MEKYNFSEPTRQSVKGVLIVVLIDLGRQIKRSIPLFALILLQWFNRPELVSRYSFPIIGFLILLFLFLFIKSVLVFKNFTFQIKGDQFYLRQGVFEKTNTVIPKSKIQNIQISQNLVQQILRVVQVNIDSSGDQGDEIQIKALSKSKAQALRIALTDENINELSEEEETIPEDEIIVRLNPLTLFFVGITQNHFRNLFIVLVAIISFYTDIEELLVKYGAAFNSEFMSSFLDRNILFGSLIIVFLLFLLGLFYSLVTIFIVNFNFILKKTNQSFIIEKGLINKIEFAIQLDKIQSVAYVTNYVKSKFGLYTLRLFQTATEVKTQKKRELIGLNTAHLRIVEKYIFGFYPLEGIQKLKPDNYYLRATVIKVFLLVLLINFYISILPSPIFFALNFALIPIFIYGIYLKWKKTYYFFDEDYVVLGSGIIDTKTSIIQISKIQSVKLTQTYFQKQRNLFNLHFNTATTHFTVPSVETEEALMLYNHILYKIETSNLVWQ